MAICFEAFPWSFPQIGSAKPKIIKHKYRTIHKDFCFMNGNTKI